MNRSLRIAVAADELDMQEYYTRILPAMGHVVVAVAATGRELVVKCRELQPDLVITDIKMPDVDGIDAASRIYRNGPIPIILVSAFQDENLVRRAGQSHVLSYLIKPIRQSNLEPAIALVMSHFAQFRDLRKEAFDLKQALEDRKTVEKAKGLVMRKAFIDEIEAHERLQILAKDQNRKIVEIASIILAAEEMVKPSDPNPRGSDSR